MGNGIDDAEKKISKKMLTNSSDKNMKKKSAVKDDKLPPFPSKKTGKKISKFRDTVDISIDEKTNLTNGEVSETNQLLDSKDKDEKKTMAAPINAVLNMLTKKKSGGKNKPGLIKKKIKKLGPDIKDMNSK